MDLAGARSSPVVATPLEEAPPNLDAGETKEVASCLWDAEVEARSDLTKARELYDLAARLSRETSGRSQREGAQLADYATRHITRLTAPEPNPLPDAPLRFEVLGGFGWDLRPGHLYRLDFDTAGITLADLQTESIAATAGYQEIISLDIGGPGEVTSGGGFIGGGFGLEGAALGMLAAGLLNALTTRSKIVTIL